MSKNTHYTFKINDFTPNTMPFGRLVQYYQELVKMLGTPESIHLVEISESSHASAFRIDSGAKSKVAKNIIGIQEGNASKKITNAHSVIDQMLKEDGTSGALLDDQENNVVVFPGKLKDTANSITIRDTATFVGELYYIIGTQDDAKVRIQTDAYGIVKCDTTRTLGKALREYLFDRVKVSGRGSWRQIDSGLWDIETFTITDFSPVKAESLRDAVENVRSADVQWPANPLEEIDKINDDKEALQ